MNPLNSNTFSILLRTTIRPKSRISVKRLPTASVRNLHVTPLQQQATEINVNASAKSIPEWRPDMATKDNISNCFQVPSSFKQQSLLPKSLNKELEYLQDPVLLLRGSTVDLIDQITKATDAKTSASPIILDGQGRIGKSSTLLLTSSHFQRNGWITIYVPQPWEWVSGWHAFTKTSSSVFEQKELAQKLCQSILDMNKSILNKLSLPPTSSIVEGFSGKTFGELLSFGSSNVESSHQVLSQFFDALTQDVSSRPPVLLAVDQVNTFYAPTEYHDTDSSVVYGDQLALCREFVTFLTGKRDLKNGAILTATDRTVTRIQSPFLNWLLTATEQIQPNTNLTNPATRLSNRRQYQDISTTSSYGVVLPDALSPAAKSPFITHPEKKSSWPMKSLRSYQIHAWEKQEVQSWMEYLQSRGFLNVKLNEASVEKRWMTSGGVPGKLIDEVVRGYI